MKIHELINKDNWSSNGHEYPCKLCALQWLMKIYKCSNESVDEFQKSARLLNNMWMTITEWNDNPKRTFQEVQETFKRANL